MFLRAVAVLSLLGLSPGWAQTPESLGQQLVSGKSATHFVEFRERLGRTDLEHSERQRYTTALSLYAARLQEYLSAYEAVESEIRMKQLTPRALPLTRAQAQEILDDAVRLLAEGALRDERYLPSLRTRLAPSGALAQKLVRLERHQSPQIRRWGVSLWAHPHYDSQMRGQFTEVAQALAKNDPDVGVRRAGLEALGLLRAPRESSLALLAKGVSDPNMAYEAVEALFRLGPLARAVAPDLREAILAGMSHELAPRAVEALARVDLRSADTADLARSLFDDATAAEDPGYRQTLATSYLLLRRAGALPTRIPVYASGAVEDAHALDGKLGQAALRRRWEQALSLARRGADLHAGENALIKLAIELGEHRTLQLLSEPGLDLRSEKDLALRLSAGAGYDTAVRMLLDGGADIHAENEESLLSAARGGYRTTVELLVVSGADLSRCRDQALVAAATHGHLDVARYLLDNHANPNALTLLAMKRAARAGHLEIVKLLHERGARLEDFPEHEMQRVRRNGRLEVITYIEKFREKD